MFHCAKRKEQNARALMPAGPSAETTTVENIVHAVFHVVAFRVECHQQAPDPEGERRRRQAMMQVLDGVVPVVR